MRERFAFREIFADETVRILVGTALLRAVRIGKIDAALEKLLDRSVVREFEPVVHGDGMNGETVERDLEHVRDHARMGGPQLSDDGETCRTIVDRQKAVPGSITCAVHKVRFPVASPTFALHDGRPFADMTLVRLPSALFRAIWNTRAALEAQELLAGLPVAMNPIVYRPLAYWPAVCGSSHPSHDLLGGEVPPEKIFDVVLHAEIVLDDEGFRFRCLAAAFCPGVGVDLEIEGAGVAVAPDFSPNSRAARPKYAGDLSVRTFLCSHAADDAAIGQGEVRIARAESTHAYVGQKAQTSVRSCR